MIYMPYILLYFSIISKSLKKQKINDIIQNNISPFSCMMLKIAVIVCTFIISWNPSFISDQFDYTEVLAHQSIYYDTNYNSSEKDSNIDKNSKNNNSGHNKKIAIIQKNVEAIKKLHSNKSSSRNDYNGKIVVGTASFYSHNFHGKITASGIVYDTNALTAASNDIAIPSIVKVTNMKNNKSIHVLINDKGPFYGNRIIDLSKKAASELGFIHNGISRVKIEYSEELTQKLLQDKKEYASYGIAISG